MDDQTLTQLRRVPGVAAVYVVAGDAVAGATVHGEIGETQGALLAAIVGALRQAAADLALGELGEAIVEAAGGAVMAGTLSGGRTAVVVAEPKANLGMIRLEMRRLRRGAS
ncbi:MAG: hypothetical protein HY332_08805 [Chloroflexi bacterium]|nr:hypothetical protein [Chloroflexota bacterium]